MPDKWAQYAVPAAAGDNPPPPADKWAQYAQPAPAGPDFSNPNGEGVYKMTGPAGPVGVPYSKVLTAQQTGYKLDPSDRDRFTKDYVGAPIAGSPSVGTFFGDMGFSHPGDALKSLGSNLLGAVKGVAEPPKTPAEFAGAAVGGPIGAPLVRMGESILHNESIAAHQTAHYASEAVHPTEGEGVGGRILNGLRAATSGALMADPMLPAGGAGMNTAIDEGRPADALGEGAADIGMLAGPAALGKLGGAAKGVLAGDVDAPMAGTDLTPRARYLGAKDLGVDLPPAQATNSRALKALDWVNREGVLSAPMHEELTGRNMTALTNAAQGDAARMSPFDPETGGRTIQDPLAEDFTDLQNRAHDLQGEMSPLEGEAGGAAKQTLVKAKQAALHDAGQQGQIAVRNTYGSQSADGLGDVNEAAKNLLPKYERMMVQTPSMVPKRVVSVLQDIANLGNEQQTATIGPPTIGDFMRNRSALLDLTQDPEIVKSQSLADLENLMKVHDTAIERSLPPEGAQAWRDANAKWKQMKSTFDDPSNPFYNAYRTPNPSTLNLGIGGTAPEALRAERALLGDQAAGVTSRANAQKLFGAAPDGSYDLRGFSGRLARMPEDTRSTLFTNPQNEELSHIGADYREMQPFERAATTENPQALTTGKDLGPQTAAGVRKLRDLPIKPEGAMGPAAPRIGEQGMGALRRGVFEDTLGNTSEGGYNFKQFPVNLKNLDPGYVQELYGPEGAARLQKIGDTAKALDVDYNRSGSGKNVQKAAEWFGLLHGNPLAWGQYPLGKFMTSPAMSDWLMEAPKPVSPALQTSGASVLATRPPARRRAPAQ